MDLGPLLARAFDRAPAREAGAAIAGARGQMGARGFSYEVLVPPDAEEHWLRDLTSRLVYHCESRRSPLPGCAGVFLSLFVGDFVFFVEARDFVAFAGSVLGMSSEAMVEAFGTGERRRVPLALPGPAKD